MICLFFTFDLHYYFKCQYVHYFYVYIDNIFKCISLSYHDKNNTFKMFLDFAREMLCNYHLKYEYNDIRFL